MMKEEKEKLSRLERLNRFTALLVSEIENFKTPLGDILSNCRNDPILKNDFSDLSPQDLPEAVESLCGDGKGFDYLRKVMEGNYEEALLSAKALYSHVEKLLSERRAEYELKKTAKAVFPVAVGFLAGILTI